jgi:hypothetical protein
MHLVIPAFVVDVHGAPPACSPILVMPGLVPGIHVFSSFEKSKTWMAGTSPAMTGQATVSLLSGRIVTGSCGRSSRNSCDVKPTAGQSY